MKRFKLTNPEASATWVATEDQVFSAIPASGKQLDALQLGETYSDCDGYTWERVE